MTRCDLGLLTSEKEGFPNVVLEMLAAKVPRVFTTNCAGDLSKIPGVWVTKNNCASDIAERIIATDEESDTEKISEFLKSRQYKDYLGQIS
jgi:glycosyltransferase involved in cell wall biosynthesis